MLNSDDRCTLDLLERLYGDEWKLAFRIRLVLVVLMSRQFHEVGMLILNVSIPPFGISGAVNPARFFLTTCAILWIRWDVPKQVVEWDNRTIEGLRLK